MLQPIARQMFRRERVPQRLLWWLSAAAMADFYRMMARGLDPHFGGRDAARRVIAEVVAETLRRRYSTLAEQQTHRAAPSASDLEVRRLMGGLYRIQHHPKARWVLAELGPPTHGLAEALATERAMRRMTIRQRWDEVSVHLGEVLIALTAMLPERGLARTSSVLGAICFDGGRAYGLRTKRALGLDDSPDAAIEVLRIGEYIFQVNPAHWSGTDCSANTGYLEGSACLWYKRPGWERLHCGIFGQFQSGISSVFGLKYRLSQTIPKRGGHTCRVDLTPISR